MAFGEIFLAGYSGQSRAGKLAPSCSLGQPITSRDLVHLAHSRSQPCNKCTLLTKHEGRTWRILFLPQRLRSFWSAPRIVTSGKGPGKVQFSEHAQSNGTKTLGTSLVGQNSPLHGYSASLHYNETYHVCEAVSGQFVVLARNCLAPTLDYVVMQMRKTNRVKGYSVISKWLRPEISFSRSAVQG